MYLTKSDFKAARSCPTKLFYKKSGYPSACDDDPYLQLLAEGGYIIEKIAQLLFEDGYKLPMVPDGSEAARQTAIALQSESVTLFEATVCADKLLARVDILKREGKCFDLIEVKAKSYDSAQNEVAIASGCRGAFWTRRDTIRPEWRQYLEDIAFQVFVLTRVFPEAEIRPYLMMPDRSKSTNIDRLHSLFGLHRDSEGRFQRIRVQFNGDVTALRRDCFLTLVSVAGEVNHLLPLVESEVQTFCSSLQPILSRISSPLSTRCKHCEYRINEAGIRRRNGFAECWGALATAAHHLLDLYCVSQVGGRHAGVVNRLFSQGKASISDLRMEQVVKSDGSIGAISRRQTVQITHTLKNEEWISDEFGPLLRKFAFPFHFIDFETVALAIPLHTGMKPYEEVVFQWSCHTLPDPNAIPVHKEWINTTDVFPNFEFAESLMNCLGHDGTVFMWASHENTILRRINDQMGMRRYKNEALTAWLKSLVRVAPRQATRLVDMNALTVRHYFHPLMKGSTSVKKVCEAVWRDNLRLRQMFPQYVLYRNGRLMSPYEALPTLEIRGRPVSVAEGTGAVRAYEAMLYGLEKDSAETKATWRKLLLQYCELDTLAMVMIWNHWLKRTTR